MNEDTCTLFFSIKNIIDKIELEFSLAKPDSDENLLPIYALLTELKDLLPDFPSFLQSVNTIQSEVDKLLEAALPFDEQTLANLSSFIEWAKAINTQDLNPANPLPHFHLLQSNKKTITPSTEIKHNYTDQLLVISPDNDNEVLSEFFNESTEHLGLIENSLMVLEKNPQDTDTINILFRSFHTIKGVAGFLQLTPIQSLAHEVESLLDNARSREILINSSIITLILQSKDKLQLLIEQVAECIQKQQHPNKIIPIANLIEAVIQENTNALLNQKNQSPTNPSAQTTNNKETEDLDPTNHKNKLDVSTIRVNTAKLDNLLDTVGELVIVQSQLEASLENNNARDTQLGRNLTQLSRITKELQHTSMSLRMVPVRPSFQKIGRIVRDLAKLFEKEVEFHVSGEDTELDRNVVEQISDPLIHMVRNSLDHGLEKPADRIKAGKDPKGNFYLKAYHQGSNIVIEIQDDGKGLDEERILKVAKEKGLILEDQELNPSEIFQLIFMPGFSTADKVTNISGRGVGMDVVRQNIEKLRGRIEILSEKGKGTTFFIKLPLTTAIIDGLIVQVGNERFVIPATSVKVALKPIPEQISTIQGRVEVLNLRGRTIPIIRIHKRFDIPTNIQNITDGILIIIETSGPPYCLFVDTMIGKREVVIKSLGSVLKKINGIAGGAILGDGNIALILDPSGLHDQNINS